MKNILKNIIFAGAFIFFVAAPVMTVATPQVAKAADCEASLIGIPPWYRGLTKEVNGDCVIVSPSEVGGDDGGISNFIWIVVLNGIQIALVITGWIALFFILYGGFLFITGGGNTAQVEKARKSIFNAVIGLVIALGSIAITNLIFGLLDGATTPNDYGVPQISGDDLLRAGINLVYYAAGIVAVIVIIIAGLMYTTSMGDAGRITRSKGMILYAVIGLVVLMAAFAITNFIMIRF
ncbi:MAG: hypothetical protein V4611_02150 [Patescibacteria group bacterium]